MKLQAILQNNEEPFEGDLTMFLRRLPADAQITRSTATIRLVVQHKETVALAGTQGNEWGVTKQGLTVDFHVRRTVHQMRVLGGSMVTVQIDVGGTWIRLNNDGTMSVPDDGGTLNFSVVNGVVDMQRVVTSRVQLSPPEGANSLLSSESVTWLCTPGNVSLRIGEQGPIRFQPGELRNEVTTADFGEFLQAYLLEAEVENDLFVVPFTLHSDSIARMEVVLEIEYTRQKSVLPPEIGEVILPFTYEPISPNEDELLTVVLPANARVVPEQTTMQVAGTFEPSRIVWGPKTPVEEDAVVPVSSACAQAQPIVVEKDVAVTAVDLLLEPLDQTTRISITILDDADGKPFGKPLLSQPAALRLDREVNGELGWVSARLPAEFQFRARGKDWPFAPLLAGGDERGGGCQLGGAIAAGESGWHSM